MERVLVEGIDIGCASDSGIFGNLSVLPALLLPSPPPSTPSSVQLSPTPPALFPPLSDGATITTSKGVGANQDKNLASPLVESPPYHHHLEGLTVVTCPSLYSPESLEHLSPTVWESSEEDLIFREIIADFAGEGGGGGGQGGDAGGGDDDAPMAEVGGRRRQVEEEEEEEEEDQKRQQKQKEQQQQQTGAIRRRSQRLVAARKREESPTKPPQPPPSAAAAAVTKTRKGSGGSKRGRLSSGGSVTVVGVEQEEEEFTSNKAGTSKTVGEKGSRKRKSSTEEEEEEDDEPKEEEEEEEEEEKPIMVPTGKTIHSIAIRVQIVMHNWQFAYSRPPHPPTPQFPVDPLIGVYAFILRSVQAPMFAHVRSLSRNEFIVCLATRSRRRRRRRAAGHTRASTAA